MTDTTAGEAMARRFHEAYERLAPSFGYATREDTKAFDPKTPNGRLMIAVCNEIAAQPSAGAQVWCHVVKYKANGWGFAEDEDPDAIDALRADPDYQVVALYDRATAAQPDTGDVSGLHHATAFLVDRFAAALKEKLAKAEAKYGYSDGWRDHDWHSDLVAKLVDHVHKGDPRDVAAYCAFAWHHGWSITPPDTGDVAALREATDAK